MTATDDLFGAHAYAEALFDALPDVVFFIKDRTGRYVRVNQTLAARCAGGDKTKLIGKRPEEVFPAPLAASYARQDESVLRTGKPVEHQLELHIYPGGKAGWCLTTKHPLRDAQGRILGVTGISRDLNAPSGKDSGYAQLASALKLMRSRFTESLRIEDIATKAGLSVYQFEQRVQKLFQMSPLQLLHKLRLDEATRLLRETDLPLGEIALQTGWCDQSAFTRHFSRYAGMAPGKFRAMQKIAEK
ncbi:MAG: AraC family transcriptional regulator [Prosthecobacter sp.]|jgi:PAS domain S-box-containing protein|uniref:AraC family transcriptional regulator n=1 Tax=Prosthecobacter sp. TaxID=1965333 RepID=UPI001A0D6930|nr:AraC family transcriptional regulator [Prosthecobacter sp.]MBE2283798.1 AraC family transcriptional regulator [Prosthecobacter sp.]